MTGLHLTPRQRLILAILLGAAIFLVATSCDGHNPTEPDEPMRAEAISLRASDWDFYYSPGMPDHPTQDGAGWRFDFPDQRGSVHYVWTRYQGGAIPAGSTLMVEFEVTSLEATFNGRVDPSDINPAHVHVMLSCSACDTTKGDDRWWITGSMGAYELGSADGSRIAISAPLDYRLWTNVYGKTSEEGFRMAMTYPGRVGVTFGGSYFYGHGVNLSSGSASFRMMDYRVN